MDITEKILRELTEELTGSGDEKHTVLQRALVPTILQKLVNAKSADAIVLKPIHSAGLSLWGTVQYILWYLLWSMKWALFLLKGKEEKMMTGSLFSEISSSRVSVRAIADTIKNKNITYVNFGILEDYSLFVTPKVFCFPYYFYRFPRMNTVSGYCEHVDGEIRNIIQRHIHSYAGGSFVKELRRLERFYEILSRFLTACRSRILVYISDTDHLDTRLIACEVHKKNSVKTIIIDHAINTFAQINNRIFSDRYCSWGEFHVQQSRRYLTASGRGTDTRIIGNPVKRFTLFTPERNGLWIYLLPSFQHQTSFTIHRNLQRTLSFISEIHAVAKSAYPDIEFIIKPHPVDRTDYSRLCGVRQIRGKLESVINDAGLIFVEDSTTSVEALSFEVPMIYIANAKGEDLLRLGESASVTVASDPSMMRHYILSALQTPIDSAVRKQAYEFYFGKHDSQAAEFIREIEQYI